MKKIKTLKEIKIFANFIMEKIQEHLSNARFTGLQRTNTEAYGVRFNCDRDGVKWNIVVFGCEVIIDDRYHYCFEDYKDAETVIDVILTHLDSTYRG